MATTEPRHALTYDERFDSEEYKEGEGRHAHYPECEHGLSAWLCMGPQHYPLDEDEMRGNYF